MPDLNSLKAGLKKLLPKERFEHSLRVMEQAEELARRFKVSVEPAGIAALLHDCSRYLNREGMLKSAREGGYKIDPIEELEPKLLHARLSAKIARDRFGVTDPDVLQAIESHTVGRPNMSKLEKVVYLADHIESDRDYSGVEKVRELADKDLDRAILASIDKMIAHLIEQDLPIFEGTILTRNWLLINNKI
ncbi:bis(5'-nucleosyl)-tetraphosphatase (symmetrical) YqeK [Candidatus Saganbacteria bacterium]|nr:bis(5'-nucleosyl)-tetraphosphatase (symmetrical) YqeK [Candidatus Saganbacteria bacterium]